MSRDSKEESYPIVGHPSKWRLLKRQNKPLVNPSGMESDGVYAWIPKEVLSKEEKDRRSDIVRVVKERHATEIDSLLKEQRPKLESLEDKVKKWRSSRGVKLSSQNELPEVIKSSSVPKKTIKPMLPIGYQQLANLVHDPPSKKTVIASPKPHTFSPLDSSLLLQDRKGREIASKLKARVNFLNNSANNSLYAGFNKDVNKNLTGYNDTRNHRIHLKGSTVKELIDSTARALSKDRQFYGINTDFDYSRLRSSLMSKKKKRSDRNLALYSLSQNITPQKDIHCSRELALNLNSDSHLANNLRTPPPLRESAQGGTSTDYSATKFNISSLPYMYLCPSI